MLHNTTNDFYLKYSMSRTIHMRFLFKRDYIKTGFMINWHRIKETRVRISQLIYMWTEKNRNKSIILKLLQLIVNSSVNKRKLEIQACFWTLAKILVTPKEKYNQLSMCAKGKILAVPISKRCWNWKIHM